MPQIFIHNKPYDVKDSEFTIYSGKEIHPLQLRYNVSQYDREIAFIKHLYNMRYINWGETHGGYVPKNVVNSEVVYRLSDMIGNTSGQNILLRLEPGHNMDIPIEFDIILADDIGTHSQYRKLSFGSRWVYIHKTFDISKRYPDVRIDWNTGILLYDNLVHILIMVKNGGEDFRIMLESNLKYADHITILDTGSTDNTLDIIDTIWKSNNRPSITVYQEPFINFKESRNRLLDLTDATWDKVKEDLVYDEPFIPVWNSEHKKLTIPTEEYAFKIFLDDTYCLQGDLRGFLSEARSDDIADSFSLFINEVDMTYSSNRITKPQRKLRYKYRIHEIIEDNTNILIPRDKTSIKDINSNYMAERTQNRKKQDLEWLFEELEESPDDPRSLYYIAETYLCMEDWNNAYMYYDLRSRSKNHGYHEERYDAFYKRAVMADLHLKMMWENCQQLYLEAYEVDPSRPESLFMIGSHYLTADNHHTAYMFLKSANELASTISQNQSKYNMNVKMDQYHYHLPKMILPLCYKFKDYKLGESISRRMKEYNPDVFLATNWLSIFHLFNCNREFTTMAKKRFCDNDLVVFIAPGGWEKWDGDTLRTKGLGGSETCIIRFAEEIAKTRTMIVFCECSEVKVVNKVQYVPISKSLLRFISEFHIDICFVHRYTEYIPVMIENQVSTYAVLHDLLRDEEVFVNNEYFKGILCLSEYHANYVREYYPSLDNKISVFSYGIDLEDYQTTTQEDNVIPYSFIYPSFPNRGLYWLLKLFPRITERYPNATLNVFCRFDLDYIRKQGEQEMIEIQKMIEEQSNVINHGWVSYDTLRKYWKRSHIWLYPCKFPETCCRVAMEAAASRTLAISNDLAALVETIGDHGITIPTQLDMNIWLEMAYKKLVEILEMNQDNLYLERNYNWVKTKSYSSVVSDFSKRFIDPYTRMESLD